MTEPIFSVEPFSAVRLTRERLPELQALYERCGDYVQLVSGAPPGPDEADEGWTSLPPGSTPADKLILGIHPPGGPLAGMIDLVRNHPAPNEWWLGLLILDPAVRQRALGTRIYAALARWIRGEGGRTVWIGVLEANPGACRFWRRQGFVEVRRQPFTADSGRAHTMIVLRHDLPPDDTA